MTNKELEILPKLTIYHSIFEEIINTPLNMQSIEDYIDFKKAVYEKYIDLRNKINNDLINNLLADLKAANN